MPRKVRSRAPKMLRESPKWVSLRKARDEHMFSALPPIAAGTAPCQHLRSAPEAAISRFLFKSGGLPYNLGVTGRRFAGAMRDTVMVPPKTTVTVAFDADNPGWWPFHCHLLCHQHAGMFSTLRYD